MASTAKTARLLVLLQIALFLFSAVIMSPSVCYGARDGGHVMTASPDYGGGVLDPNRPACIGYSQCPERGRPYTHRGYYTPPHQH
ncbi:hypothetical protein BS78_10G178200 [Paspalum vaginatum]|nr:hypothetical protein BS78_10G178200 [Paspalum vaginatum]